MCKKRIIKNFRHFYSKLKGGTNCYTVEVSFYGYKKNEAFNYKVYTEEACILFQDQVYIVELFHELYFSVYIFFGFCHPLRFRDVKQI